MKNVRNMQEIANGLIGHENPIFIKKMGHTPSGPFKNPALDKNK